jgi:general secretion pathway protein D
MRLRLVPLLCSLLVWCCAHATGAEPSPQTSGRRIAPTATMELQHLIDLTAHELGVTIEYTPASIKQSVTVRSPAGLEPRELWTLLNELLIARGHTTIRIGSERIFSVVKLSEAADLVRPEPVVTATAPAGAAAPLIPGFAARAVQLTDLDAAAASALAKPLLSRSGSVSVLDPMTIVVAEQASRLDRIIRAVQAADRPSEGVQLIEVPALELGPVELSEAVMALADRIRSASGEAVPGQVAPAPAGRAVLIIAPATSVARWQELITLADRKEHTESRTYGVMHYGASSAASLIEELLGQADGDGAVERRVIVDELTGSLIVTAAPREHDEITAIVERLNDRPAEARRVVRVFPIRNRSVQDVASLLSRLMGAGVLVEAPAAEEGSGGDDSDVRQRASSSGGGSSRSSRADRQDQPADVPDVVITPDPSTNRIIAVGEPRMLDEVEQLLERLDVRQPQVMLEVTIVGLTEGLSHDLGVELERISIDGSTVLRLSSLFGLGDTDASSDTLPSDRGIGFTGSLLNPMDYSILIRALETISEGRTLSRPRVLVGNNQQATFDSVLQEPFASVNASDTVATTSFGGTQDAGTSISIRPQIAEADHIVLEYSVRLSSFVGESANAALPPPRQQNSVQSSVMIPDGHAVVVGGIELTSTGDAESRIPVVGDVPLIGELFKSRSKSNSRSRFYVFIRADVMRRHGFDGLRAISAEAMQEAGVDDGWPTVEPEIMR